MAVWSCLPFLYKINFKINMKKILVSGILLVSVFALTGGAYAAKPAGNYAGAVKYAWHLSGDVMPVPPYGSMDIPGSDTASKLIVNQPNGKVLANMTGVMNGLNPNTEYTVYLSKMYKPAVFTGWNVAGPWVVAFDYLGTPYAHDMSITQSGDTITGGSGGYPAGGTYGYTWVIDSGLITGSSATGATINMTAHYTASADAVTPLTTMTMTGTIAANGTMSGTWSDNYAGGSRSGTWSTTSGQAIKNYTGSLGWTGLLTPTVQPFTFMTNGSGSGSWHINLRTENITLPTDFSAWINGSGATILISDSVHLY